jgi:hypothetical protein
MVNVRLGLRLGYGKCFDGQCAPLAPAPTCSAQHVGGAARPQATAASNCPHPFGPCAAGGTYMCAHAAIRLFLNACWSMPSRRRSRTASAAHGMWGRRRCSCGCACAAADALLSCSDEASCICVPLSVGCCELLPPYLRDPTRPTRSTLLVPGPNVHHPAWVPAQARCAATAAACSVGMPCRVLFFRGGG